MKQMKFFLVALMALVMGMSVTSCMKGDDNSIVPVSGIITLKSTFPYQFQVEGSDVVFEASSMTIPGLASDAYNGDIVLLYSQYDSKTQAVDQNTKKVIVEVSSALKLNVNASATTSDVEYNRSIIPLSTYGSNLTPYLYSANWLIFPIPYYVEKEENASSHMFYLVYDKTHADNNETTMVLRLRHSSSEDVKDEKIVNTGFKAFRITSLVSEFESGSNKLKTIKIIAQEQYGNSPEIKKNEDGSYDTTSYRDQGYTITNYDKFVK